MTIVDREGLEAASCECYRTTTDLLNAVTERARRDDVAHLARARR